MTASALSLAKHLLGPAWTVKARCLLRGFDLPRWGNLRRVRPFSEYFGFERGTPVDRQYVHQFLEQHRSDISGDVLEIQMPSYTQRFGRAVRTSHTLDVNPAFKPTYCCDLARAEGIVPDAAYDCFLMPQTLSFLRDLEPALMQALRVVRPGGVVLATTAAFCPLIPDGPDYWRMSADGWRVVSERVWAGCEVAVTAYGNCLAAAASMYGIAAEELTAAELAEHDPRYPVLVALRCRKPASWT